MSKSTHRYPVYSWSNDDQALIHLGDLNLHGPTGTSLFTFSSDAMDNSYDGPFGLSTLDADEDNTVIVGVGGRLHPYFASEMPDAGSLLGRALGLKSSESEQESLVRLVEAQGWQLGRMSIRPQTPRDIVPPTQGEAFEMAEKLIKGEAIAEGMSFIDPRSREDQVIVRCAFSPKTLDHDFVSSHTGGPIQRTGELFYFPEGADRSARLMMASHRLGWLQGINMADSSLVDTGEGIGRECFGVADQGRSVVQPHSNAPIEFHESDKMSLEAKIQTVSNRQRQSLPANLNGAAQALRNSGGTRADRLDLFARAVHAASIGAGLGSDVQVTRPPFEPWALAPGRALIPGTADSEGTISLTTGGAAERSPRLSKDLVTSMAMQCGINTRDAMAVTYDYCVGLSKAVQKAEEFAGLNDRERSSFRKAIDIDAGEALKDVLRAEPSIQGHIKESEGTIGPRPKL